MMTPFQRQKNVHYFNVLDADKNGFIERADFEEIGHRFATAIGLQPGTPGYDQLRAGVLTIWEEMQPDLDENGDGRGSLEEFLRFQDRVIYEAAPEAYDAYVNNIVRGLFDLTDTDRDGMLTATEYRNVFYGFRLDESQVDDAFRHVDANGDGLLSLEENIAAVREFHWSDDPNAPGNWVFGKVPD